MRKLPVFFLIDVSESMVGQPIEWVTKGMEYLIKGLKTNPYALETVWIEIIAFAGKAKVIENYEELPMFYPPNFNIGGGSAFGEGISLLMSEFDTHVKRSTPTSKGDWKPLVFIFTDGQPTDEYQESLDKWEAQYKTKCQTLMATLGDCCSTDLLSKIGGEAIKLEDSNEESFNSYFKWMTDSIAKSSELVSVGIQSADKKVDLSKESGLAEINLEKKDNTKQIIDDTYTVLIGACQKQQEKYLIKYKKGIEHNPANYEDFRKVYRLEGAFKIDYKSYVDMSGSRIKQQISTEFLRGIPACPYCHSPHSVAVCKCGGIFCFNEQSQTQTCGWCGESGTFGQSEGNFDIDRRLG